LALEDLWQLIEREIDAVVADPALRIIISADALRAVAGTDLATARGSAGRIELLPLVVIEARAQHRHRLGAITMLRAVFLHHDYDAGRQMGQPNRRFSLVDVLTAGAPRAQGIDLEITFIDRDVDVFGLGQHRDGRGRSMDAARAFGLGHALHAVHAGLEFEPSESAASSDLGDDFLVAAHAAFACRHHLNFPAVLGSEALVHAEQV